MSSVIRQSGSSTIFLELDGQWYWYDANTAPLGSGSMGVVYLGYNYYSGEPVAVKYVREEYASVPSIRQRARFEAGLTILHPNVVRILGVCEYAHDYGAMYILSEYVHGRTLDRYCRETLNYMSKQGRIIAILQVMLPVLDALAYIHKIGVIHRDIKPSNIMVSSDGIPKLMDLGIAKFDGNVHSNTSAGCFIGTSLYAAPELASGMEIDYRIDIYAAGVTIFELITGYNPFDGNNMQEILMKQLQSDLPCDLYIPSDLYAILRTATAKNRNDRYASADFFAYDLRDFLNKYV